MNNKTTFLGMSQAKIDALPLEEFKEQIPTLIQSAFDQFLEQTETKEDAILAFQGAFLKESIKILGPISKKENPISKKLAMGVFFFHYAFAFILPKIMHIKRLSVGLDEAKLNFIIKMAKDVEQKMLYLCQRFDAEYENPL